MRTTRSPSAEMPHSVGALMDTAFVRSAFAEATELPGTPHVAPPSAWARAIAWARAALGRPAAPA